MTTHSAEITRKRKEVHRARSRLIVTLSILLLVIIAVLYITLS